MKYLLKSNIEIELEEEKYLEILKKILEDEDKKIGKRAEFTFKEKELLEGKKIKKNNKKTNIPYKIMIEIKAKDATALKTAISAITTIIQLTENALNIK